MQPGGVVEPDDQGPGFLGIPAPVATPGFGRPQRTEYRSNGKEGKAHRNRLVHQVIQQFERRQLGSDAAAAKQNTAHRQRGHAEIHHPEAEVALPRALAEDQGLKAQHQAQYAQRRKFGPARFPRLLLDQIGKRHHGREGKRTVTNEVGRHVQLHPPALERRHQRLNLLRLARHRVPKQKSHSGADHKQYESAECARVVVLLVIQVEQRGDPAEQHKHFIEVADRDMAHVHTHQIAFVPAHHGADQRHAHRHPGQARADQRQRGTLAARGHAKPVKGGAHEEQHAHPQNRRLAGEKVFEPEHRFGPRQLPLAVDLVGRNGEQGCSGHHQHQRAQRSPKPAQRHERRNRCQQDAFFVHIHIGCVALEGEQAARSHDRGEQPVKPVAPRKHALIEGNGRIRRGACGRIHALPPVGATPMSLSVS